MHLSAEKLGFHGGPGRGHPNIVARGSSILKHTGSMFSNVKPENMYPKQLEKSNAFPQEA